MADLTGFPYKRDSETTTGRLTKQVSSSLRIAHIDGLRGLAALYVVIFHIFLECTENREMPSYVLQIMKFINYPQLPVAVFIVLSGYCLMMPIAQSGKSQVLGGIGQYLKRRVKRILLPYYVALTLSILLMFLTVGLNRFLGIQWDSLSIDFQPGTLPQFWSVIAHFLCLNGWHLAILASLHVDSAAANVADVLSLTGVINVPLWTVAVLWQLYLLFPLFFLPIYRKFGIVVLVLTSIVFGIAPLFIWPNFPVYHLSPWFISLFAFGIAAAIINFSPDNSIIRFRRRIPWGMLTAITWISLLFILIPRPPLGIGISVKFAYWTGIGTAFLLIYMTHIVNERDFSSSNSLVLRLLTNPYLVGVGAFSYSLYLTHAPVVVLTHQLLLNLHLQPQVTFLMLLLISLPLSLLVGRYFYSKVELFFQKK